MEAMKQKQAVHNRWMIRRDNVGVCAIDGLCFREYWRDEDFIKALRNRNCIGMVAESHEHIRGFNLYELHKNRLTILRFAVHPTWQRLGIGTQMLDKLKGKLAPRRRTKLQIAIPESNLGGLLFFKSQGFRATSLISDYYPDSTDDAIIMEYRL